MGLTRFVCECRLLNLLLSSLRDADPDAFNQIPLHLALPTSIQLGGAS